MWSPHVGPGPGMWLPLAKGGGQAIRPQEAAGGPAEPSSASASPSVKWGGGHRAAAQPHCLLAPSGADGAGCGATPLAGPVPTRPQLPAPRPAAAALLPAALPAATGIPVPASAGGPGPGTAEERPAGGELGWAWFRRATGALETLAGAPLLLARQRGRPAESPALDCESEKMREAGGQGALLEEVASAQRPEEVSCGGTLWAEGMV